MTIRPNSRRGLGQVQYFTGPQLAELIEHQPGLAASITRLVATATTCVACDGPLPMPPALWVRMQLPSASVPVIAWGCVCDDCAERRSDLTRLVLAGLRRDRVLLDPRIIDHANLHCQGGSA